MQCSFQFCIFQKDGICIKGEVKNNDEIKINSFGKCEYIELVDMDDEILEPFKKMERRRIEITRRYG